MSDWPNKLDRSCADSSPGVSRFSVSPAVSKRGHRTTHQRQGIDLIEVAGQMHPSLRQSAICNLPFNRRSLWSVESRWALHCARPFARKCAFVVNGPLAALYTLYGCSYCSGLHYVNNRMDVGSDLAATKHLSTPVPT